MKKKEEKVSTNTESRGLKNKTNIKQKHEAIWTKKAPWKTCENPRTKSKIQKKGTYQEKVEFFDQSSVW